MVLFFFFPPLIGILSCFRFLFILFDFFSEFVKRKKYFQDSYIFIRKLVIKSIHCRNKVLNFRSNSIDLHVVGACNTQKSMWGNTQKSKKIHGEKVLWIILLHYHVVGQKILFSKLFILLTQGNNRAYRL